MAEREKQRGEWVPLMTTLVLGAAVLLVYPWMVEAVDPVVYAQVSFTACVPAILPLLGRLTKRRFPLMINALIALHMVLASFLGSAMQFYRLVPWWDLLMHGFFGFVGSVVLYTFLLKWNGKALNRVGFLLLIFLSVMGCGALWEIFEYLADALIGGDAQRVAEALQLGTSPIADTMTDIIVTVAGIVVFYLVLFLDKRRGYPVSRHLEQ